MADPFLIRWTDPGITLQASEAAYSCSGDWLDMTLSDRTSFTTDQKAPNDKTLFGAMPTSKGTMGTVTGARRVGPHDFPIQWRIASGGEAFAPGKEHAIGLSTRLRFSLSGYGGSWVDQSKSTGAIDRSLLALLKNAPIDDLSLVQTIQFNEQKPGDVKWSKALLPNGNSGLRKPYLKDLIEQMHAIGIQVRAGYEIVEEGAQHSVVGDAFSAWLLGSSGKAPDIDGHVQQIVQFLWGQGLDFDGIGFDLEVNGLTPAHGPNLARLIQGTAKALAPMNKFVTYDNAPSLDFDGDNHNKFMQIQPYGLCRNTPNLVARPMCYNDEPQPAPKTSKTIACALRSTASTGGAGLHPSQVQLAFRHWGKKSLLDKAEIIKRCKEILRPNRIGLVLYPIPIPNPKKDDPKMDLSAVRKFLPELADYDAALNPSDPRGRPGQPLQVPRKPR